ncbi:MAG: hypothetical protein H0X66_00605 [Verrucomicrobia bacterium]|nr:hypothetical protein [Verrucomicrobiota bacterium]
MRSHRPIFLLIGTIAANLIFLALVPNVTDPPRLAGQMDKALLTLALSLLPFAWGFYLLFFYRSFPERVLAYLAIAVSLLWVGISTKLIIDVIKDRSVHWPKPDADRAGIARRLIIEHHWSGLPESRTSA